MEIERQSMDVDIVCVGFGPASAGFLTTLSRGLVDEHGMPVAESVAMPGMPPQVICYERADDVGFGVSGVVTKAEAIKASFPDQDFSEIPNAHSVTEEKVVWMFDPQGPKGPSRRSRLLTLGEKAMKLALKARDAAVELPYIPPFLDKHGGLVLSIGQFCQWAGANVMGSGLAQVWPGMPVQQALLEQGRVVGVRLADQGVDKAGTPEAGFMPGMDIKAQLTVVGDGPVGAVGRQLDQTLGLPDGHHQRDWAVGMKMVVELPADCPLQPGCVLHTLGYPEPEIFGFLYVYPNNIASMGIFVPSWFDSPVRTAYRYLQHWMLHPYIQNIIKGGKLLSWGAKSIQEAGKQGEPFLVGDGFARIGEGSGSTNCLTNSGVDEAWATGAMLGEAVLELLKENKPFTKENLEATYLRRRRNSWVEAGALRAAHARDGFQKSLVQGLLGVGLAGMTNGRWNWPAKSRTPQSRIPTVEAYYKGRIAPEDIEAIRKECKAKGLSLHDALMDRAGWPEIPLDGELFISHQDALLLGGKVQAPAGYADHVRFASPELCRHCREQVCVEACSGQAITTNPEDGPPLFDREKCVHCGACLWNCSKNHPQHPERTNVDFLAGAGGLHSADN
nr:4Fe-4S dicluster domain-containing protein [Megalodesulfovibrio gigas]